MGWKSTIIKPFASRIYKQITDQKKRPLEYQKQWFETLIKSAKNTQFGRDHDFRSISNYEDFKEAVPLRDFELLKHYISAVKEGQSDILWPGRPKYMVGTSGTTSGIKYIPLSKECLPFHLNTARDAAINFAYKYELLDLFDGKLIFLSGNPDLDYSGAIPIGRLSGIINHEIPWWLRKLQIPSPETNRIDDWEQKIAAITKETNALDVRMIGGITPWIMMYLESLISYTGKSSIADIFPNLRLMIHGGVNFRPYREKLYQLLGSDVAALETYPSTEGFVAFQDEYDSGELLLNVNAGVFYEFVPMDSFHDSDPPRYDLSQVEIDHDYAIIINNNAGLWGSKLGDIIRFSSINPYRLKITGRTAHFISAFGEHVIAHDVEQAMSRTCRQLKVSIQEFTVAPYVAQEASEVSYHDWYVEFENMAISIQDFARVLDIEMQKQNFHYRDLVQGKVIASLKIQQVRKGGFSAYMKSIGKLGGQNKVPRLMNDRSLVTKLKVIK